VQPLYPLPVATPVCTVEDARAEVDAALRFDRSATKMLGVAEVTLAAAHAGFVECVDGGSPGARSAAADAVQMALGGHAFATSYQTICRRTLTDALDALGGLAQSDSGGAPGPGASLALAAQVVMAEADAIAAAEEAEMATETARTARQTSDRLTAENVAVTATQTALDAQTRADELADAASVATSAAVALGTSSPRQEPTARGQLGVRDETAPEADVVAHAVKSAAVAPATLAETQHPTTQQARR
jgi:hypothetical protein